MFPISGRFLCDAMCRVLRRFLYDATRKKVYISI